MLSRHPPSAETHSLQAYELYLEGRQYIVRDNEVVLIDESTGRLRPITRWQGGLHQVRGGGQGSARPRSPAEL